MKTKQQIKKL